jgi:hypothetical protein
VHGLHQDNEFGVPGTKTNRPFDNRQTRDDRAEFHLTEGGVAVRRQIGARNSLWAGIFGLNQREERTNPDNDLSFTFDALIITSSVTRQQLVSRSHSPELRFDRVLGSQQNGGTFHWAMRGHAQKRAFAAGYLRRASMEALISLVLLTFDRTRTSRSGMHSYPSDWDGAPHSSGNCVTRLCR